MVVALCLAWGVLLWVMLLVLALLPSVVVQSVPAH
jgi:hypothetical protein